MGIRPSLLRPERFAHIVDPHKISETNLCQSSVIRMSSLARALGSAAAQLGAAAARTKKKKITTTKKKKNKMSVASLAGMISNPARSRTVRAPVVSTASFSRSIRGRDPVAQIPFVGPTLYVVTDGAGHVLTNTTGSGASALGAMDLNPLNGNYAATTGGPSYSYAPFGIGLARVASAFAQFRIRKLKFRYQSIMPTSTPGQVLLAWTRDSNVATAGGITFANVAATRPSRTYPVWIGGDDSPWIVVPDGNTEEDWRFVATTDATNAIDRMTNYGSLLSQGYGLGTLNAYIGTIELEGVMEFRDLFDTIDMNPTSAVSSNSGNGQGPTPPLRTLTCAQKVCKGFGTAARLPDIEDCHMCMGCDTCASPVPLHGNGALPAPLCAAKH